MGIYTTLSRLGQYTAADEVDFPNPQDRFLAFSIQTHFFPIGLPFQLVCVKNLEWTLLGYFYTGYFSPTGVHPNGRSHLRPVLPNCLSAVTRNLQPWNILCTSCCSRIPAANPKQN